VDPVTLASVVLLAPAAAFALIGCIPPLRVSGRPAAFVSILGIGTSLAASIALLAAFASRSTPVTWEYLWAPLADGGIRFGLLLDGVSVPMLAVVSGIAFLIQVYSLAYMSEEEPGSFGRYFAYHSLFAFAMLGLVSAHNTLQTYVFWELVGLGSYLLIGFWYRKPDAARAALKAFWTTRLGDVGFALGVVVLWAAGGSFVFSELFDAASEGTLAGTALVAGVAGLYIGAMGKSAQFPFHIWLPDAMEGPTPVSALIHAATMVAAGVYLMVRLTPLLLASPETASWVLGIGVLTAFAAATMALVERDIKRVLAFSTVSQLGYMMAAVGAGAAAAGYFHLFTHAFFKALLFLAAGSVIHAIHTNDLFEMGGLRKPMRFTMALFAVGGIALCGIWPTAGFFSKDAVLIGVFEAGHPFAFAVLLATAGLTAFYMTRAFALAFLGSPRKDAHAHESPWTMLGPMAVLGVFAIVLGFFGPAILRMVRQSESLAGGFDEHHAVLVPILGTAAALFGIVLGWTGYARPLWSPGTLARSAAPVTRFLERRWYVDDVFLLLYRTLYLRGTAVVGWFDRFVVDGVVNAVTAGTAVVSRSLRRIQTGRVQDALYAVVAGLIVLLILGMRG
jgi:NADH-quinone oxidoreductase subunit L